MTEHYYIALENPMRLDLTKMATEYALGRACLAECLKFDPSRRTKIHLIPRPGRLGEFRSSWMCIVAYAKSHFLIEIFVLAPA